LTIPEVRRLLEVAMPLPPHSPELRLLWSNWRRAKRQQARRSHRRRKLIATRLSFDPNNYSP